MEAAPRTTLQDEDGTETLSPGRPDASELDLRGRAILGSAIAADLVLRTGVASLITAASAPRALRRGQLAEELRQVDFYADLAATRDPERSFPRAPRGVRVDVSQSHQPPAPLGFRPSDGLVETLRFESPFRAVNPAARAEYASHKRNRIAVAQRWRHSDGPHPTLCVVHGFMASPYWLNSAFFALPWFYDLGYDVLLYTLPFHGPRGARRDALLNGSGYFAYGMSHFNEAVAQAVHDFGVFADFLEDEGVEQIGMTGLSLGGYTTALMAAVEPRLQVAIPNAPVIDLPSLTREWFPAGQVMRLAQRLGGVEPGEMERGLAVHSPLNYDPVVPFERRMIIGGLGDRLAPPSQAEALWEHWGQPRLHWYPGNHTLHVNRGAYLKEMGRFMYGNGFGRERREHDRRAAIG